MRLIRREPTLSFGDVEWLDGASIDDGYRRLLPDIETVIDPETMNELRAAFDAGGEFEVKTAN
jgi:hypothetical protein